MKQAFYSTEISFWSTIWA